MTKEFYILLGILLLTGLGIGVTVSLHDDTVRKSKLDEVQQSVALELRNKSLRFFRQRALYDAEANLRRLIKINPDDREMMLLYGRVLFETGRSDEAEKIFRKILSFAPYDSGARNNLAVALLMRHQYEAALREFTTAARSELAQEYAVPNVRTAQLAAQWMKNGEKFVIAMNARKIYQRCPGAITVILLRTPEQAVVK